MHPAPRSALVIFAGLLAVLFVGPPAAFAADVNGSPLCTATGDQFLPVAASDGSGGIIVVWRDSRATGPGTGVCYAQRIDAAGVRQWALDGVQLSTTADPGTPVIAPDGAGGAFIAFGGFSSPPRVQRVDASGAPQWGADGVQLTTDASSTRHLAIATDIGGTGGAFVAWRMDNGAGGTADVYAQKVNSAGALQWGSFGIAIAATNMNNEGNPAMVSDGAGGALFAWISGAGVRAQRFDGSGTSVWNQVTLAASGNNNPPSIVSDGASGAVLAWAGGGAFIQRVTSVGVRAWSPANGGVALSTSGRAPMLIADGGGGAIVIWEDNRAPSNFNIYAQKMNSTGTAQWTPDGVEICMATQDQRSPVIVTDGSGGALISWYDARNAFSGLDVYAQRIDGTGASLWQLDGVAICTAPNNQDAPTTVSDGAGGAWVAWEDLRTGTNLDVYAARFNSGGVPLSVPPGGMPAWASRAWPNPFSDRVSMEFALPAPATVRSSVHDLLGRVVADLGASSLSAGLQRITWDGRASDGRRLGGGLYFIRVEGPGLTLSRPVVRLE